MWINTTIMCLGVRILARLGLVLINAQIEGPFSGANRKTFARSELYRLRTRNRRSDQFGTVP
jgi:hypothetical protein